MPDGPKINHQANVHDKKMRDTNYVHHCMSGEGIRIFSQSLHLRDNGIVERTDQIAVVSREDFGLLRSE
jgi:hypothetical protein